MNENTRVRFGVGALAESSVNCVTGCSYGCLYCSVQALRCDRLHVLTRKEWSRMRVRQHEVDKKRRKVKGRIMFPTAHDITPKVYDCCRTTLEHMLAPGNEVLVASKPNIECVKRLLYDLMYYRRKISFLFTITSLNNRRSRLWEPKAPLPKERIRCLKLAFEKGFQTNVNIEPCLDVENVHAIVNAVEKYVTETIWVGPMFCVGKVKGKGLKNEKTRLQSWTKDKMKADYKRLRKMYGKRVKFTKTFSDRAGV